MCSFIVKPRSEMMMPVNSTSVTPKVMPKMRRRPSAAPLKMVRA